MNMKLPNYSKDKLEAYKIDLEAIIRDNSVSSEYLYNLFTKHQIPYTVGFHGYDLLTLHFNCIDIKINYNKLVRKVKLESIL